MFSKIDTYEKWDRGDGIGGVLNEIHVGVADYGIAFQDNLPYVFSNHPTMVLLCQDLYSKSMNFFRLLTSRMSILYRELLIKTAGTENAPAAAKKTCWTVVLTLL